MRPKTYRNTGATALHVMARIEQVVESGATIETDAELGAPFVEVAHVVTQEPERNAAEPQVISDAS